MAVLEQYWSSTGARYCQLYRATHLITHRNLWGADSVLSHTIFFSNGGIPVLVHPALEVARDDWSVWHGEMKFLRGVITRLLSRLVESSKHTENGNA